MTDITVEQLGLLFTKFRAPSWSEKATTIRGETETPGIYYHGSPDVNIREFRSRIERPNELGTVGVFFTENPTYAAAYAVRNSNGFGGRIYRAEIATDNPFFHDSYSWVETVASEDRLVERSTCIEMAENGHDAIVSLMLNETVHELIVLDDKVVRRRDADLKGLKPWTSPSVYEALLFFQVEGLAGPDYAPGCVRLFGKKKYALLEGLPQRVAVNAVNPVYCEQEAWPKMDFGWLRLMNITCLVDPRDRSAIVIDPSEIHWVNRDGLRQMKAKARRQAKGGAR